MPAAWQLLAGEIFVGRAFDAEVQATAETLRSSRIVRISLQYTNVLYAYATAWDEQGAARNQVILEALSAGLVTLDLW